jgi:UDP-3-O-[3-hydroxymyristoyl] glucosamine N-acyltransferase
MATTVGALARQLEGDVLGDPDRVIEGAAAIDKAGPQDLAFVTAEQHLRKLQATSAGAVIAGRQIAVALADGQWPFSLIFVEDPQAAFVQALCQLRAQRARPALGISPQAHVNPSVRIGENTNIYPGVFVGEGAVIGAGCDLYPGVYVGADCVLGDGVVLHPNVVLYPDVTIGNRVTVHASAVLGADGFGYRFEGGRFEKIPHLGSVQIEDDVEIGAGTTIDRGMIGPTIVGEGTKLDNQIMIGHNCELGRHNAFASQVGFAGSVTTGDYVRCAGQVGVADHVHLGENCVLGARAGVHKDVPAGQTYLGAPAGPEAEQRRIVMALVKLPELRKQVRALEAQLKELQSQMQTPSAGEITS